MGYVLQTIWTCDRCGATVTIDNAGGRGQTGWTNVTLADLHAPQQFPPQPQTLCDSCSALVRAALTPPGQATLTPTV